MTQKPLSSEKVEVGVRVLSTKKARIKCGTIRKQESWCGPSPQHIVQAVPFKVGVGSEAIGVAQERPRLCADKAVAQDSQDQLAASSGDKCHSR